MIVRTSAIDRLINEALSAGVDTVLNLGAGMDTRPYRMEFPATLCWVEADFPSIVESKNVTLSAVQPTCRIERDLHAEPSIRYWIQDFDTAGQRSLPRGWEDKLRAAPLLFSIPNWFEYFANHGWRSSRVITSFEESEKIGRPYPFDFPSGLLMRFLPKDMRQRILSLSGAVLMHSTA